MPLTKIKGEVDFEWLLLIQEAKEIGISKEDILNFLRENMKLTGNLEKA